MNRATATNVLLGARIVLGVGIGLLGVALLVPVSADAPELPAPPPLPEPAPQAIEQTRDSNFDASQVGITLASLAPQREIKQPGTVPSQSTEDSGSEPTATRASTSFDWRYLGRITTPADPWAVLDLGSGQQIVRKGETLDHPQLGPFTLTEVEESRAVLAGLDSERILERAPRQANALGSFSAPATTAASTQPLSRPTQSTRGRRTPDEIEREFEDRMDRSREQLLRLREQRLRERQLEAEKERNN